MTAIVFSTIIPKTSVNSEGEADHAWWIRPAAPVLAGVLTGAIGLRIMEKHMDVEGFKIIHAVRAGAVGGVSDSHLPGQHSPSNRVFFIALDDLAGLGCDVLGSDIHLPHRLRYRRPPVYPPRAAHGIPHGGYYEWGSIK